jgi:recombination protein RecT
MADLARSNVETIRALFQRSRAQVELALPKHLSVDRLLRVTMTSIQRTPRLAECTPFSLIGSLMQCASLGLEPDGVSGMAFLVPYWNSKRGAFEAQLQTGYKGFMELAYRSEQVLKFDAHAVYAADEFAYAYGMMPHLVHVPDRGAEHGDVVAAYAVAWLKDIHDPLFRVLERWEVDAARARSKSQDEGPWVTDFEAMAVKTALKRLCKLLRQTPELARAIGLDDLAEAQKPQGLELLAEEALPGEVVPSDPKPASPSVQRQAAETKANDKPASTVVISGPQLKRLFALMRGHHTEEELKNYLLATYSIESASDILRSDYDAIVKWASGGTP